MLASRPLDPSDPAARATSHWLRHYDRDARRQTRWMVRQGFYGGAWIELERVTNAISVWTSRLGASDYDEVIEVAYRDPEDERLIWTRLRYGGTFGHRNQVATAVVASRFDRGKLAATFEFQPIVDLPA